MFDTECLLFAPFDTALTARLDEWHHRLSAGLQISQTVKDIISGLNEESARSTPGAWQAVVATARSHPLFDTLLQDPFTAWAYNRPLGYPGDPTLFDFIYGRHEVGPQLANASAIGNAIYAATRTIPRCRAIRARREFLASKIDEIGFEVKDGRVLSVACGYFREGFQSRAVSTGALDALVAIDHDPAALDEVERCYFGPRLETHRASHRDILLGRLQALEPFDLIYTNSLFDHLDPDTSGRVTAALFSLLKPKGKLIISSFTTSICDGAYAEAFMGWTPTYRTPQELMSIAGSLPITAAGCSLYSDDFGSLRYLQLTR
jgi:SAM-dependent methyltransferase